MAYKRYYIPVEPRGREYIEDKISQYEYLLDIFSAERTKLQAALQTEKKHALACGKSTILETRDTAYELFLMTTKVAKLRLQVKVWKHRLEKELTYCGQ